MDFWIFLLPILILMIILLSYKLEYQIKWRRKVNEDFLNARGSMHRKIIQDCLVTLNQKISSIDERLKCLSMQRADLVKRKEKEMEVKLTAQMVDTELTTIPGIGIVLKDRIVRQCFDGTLESLYRAGNVQGIGEEKNQAIRQWVGRTRSRIPKLLIQDFPEKSKIMKLYADLDKKIEQELNAKNVELQDFQQLRNEATVALNSLKTVSKSTFSDAYRGDDKASKMVTQYLIGVFPKWGRMPTWLKTLMEKHSTM
ncbi:MAG: hypothetical protein V1850_06185 [Candidatus Bathyarchaeota archaeon]